MRYARGIGELGARGSGLARGRARQCLPSCRRHRRLGRQRRSGRRITVASRRYSAGVGVGVAFSACLRVRLRSTTDVTRDSSGGMISNVRIADKASPPITTIHIIGPANNKRSIFVLDRVEFISLSPFDRLNRGEFYAICAGHCNF